MNSHQIRFPDPTQDEERTGIHFIVECETCNSPDGYGAGETVFTGATADEAWDKFSQHVEESE